ncbi:hypothetical protein MPNT_190029 [Candidatus Methylacidithermus pantelleriae]|uniref:Uncharacterized protein n=2 Tax=Candidatus Methylacidithermus pantelleriae TaxID=2744239 RepID=A0A8J2BP11_9BACT|nr:hypothetical protein MPNT_190029 [Candidatus Methylacidithermus pantelleriae]
MEVEGNGVRDVIARKNRLTLERSGPAGRTGWLLPRRYWPRSPKTITQRADLVKLGNPVGWGSLLRLNPKIFWSTGSNLKGRFWWKRKERSGIPEKEAIDKWYLLVPHVSLPEAFPGKALTHYERLAEV